MSTKSFIPAKFEFPLLWLTDLSLPILFKTIFNLDAVLISENDKEKLRSLKEERLVFCSNHPSIQEPAIAYYIANQMESRFHYMASREVFEWGGGIVGNLISRMGAFSVLAGNSDLESSRAAKRILAIQGGKLALFPEGEPTSALNDTLLPLQPGMVQLGFWSLLEARKGDKKAEIIIQPSFVKYIMSSSRDSQKREIERSLDRLEQKLGIQKFGKTVVHRFLSVAKRILERAEKEFGIHPEEEQSFDYRAGRVRHAILDNIAQKAEIPHWNLEDNAIEKLRKILAASERALIGFDDPDRELPNLDAARWARRACSKAYDFIAMNTEYLTSHPSSERMHEWLYRFENELLGDTHFRPHMAVVHLTESIQLSKYLTKYKKDKKKTVLEVTDKIRKDMESALQASVDPAHIIFDLEFQY